MNLELNTWTNSWIPMPNFRIDDRCQEEFEKMNKLYTKFGNDILLKKVSDFLTNEKEYYSFLDTCIE